MLHTGSGGVFDVETIEDRPGFIALRVSGKGSQSLMETEPGGHRWQEPSGKKGHIHTSTITVAVLDEVSEKEYQLDLSDVSFSFYRASGAGGQHRNKTDSACRAIHTPSGIVVRAENARSQHVNKATAIEALRAKLSSSAKEAAQNERSSDRKGQVGTGMRADKIRTIRMQDNIVTCHRTNNKHKTKAYLKGDLSWL